MTTARDLIKSALKKIAALGTGSSLSAEDASDAFVLLNSMLASFSASGGLIFTQGSQTFPLTTATSYTIGVGGDFDTPRPLYFSSVFTTQGNIDYSLAQLSEQEYAALVYKNVGGGIPDSYYFDANYPLGTIFLYPIPTSVSSITLGTITPLTSFTDLDTVFTMPPEYEAFLVYNLAVWIAPEYEREASPTVKKIATETKNSVMAQVGRNEKMLGDVEVISSSSQNSGDIYGGYWT